KEMSHVEGRRTIGIETKWTIPEVYTYRWYVNGVEQIEQKNRFFFGDQLNVGDEVKLTINMIESPDIQTQSASFIITESTREDIDSSAKYAISSNGKGRLDLGYVDLFRKEFTIDFWVKAETEGVILANRQMNYAAAKGFLLRYNFGNLVFTYSPDHIFPQPNNEVSIKQDDNLNAGPMALNEWTHVAVTQKQDSIIEIYVNGQKRVSSSRILPEYDLNNAVYLSLFADGYEMYPMEGSVDQLRIFGKRMDSEEIRRLMYGKAKIREDRLYFMHDFNTPQLSSLRESFSQADVKPRIMAEASFETNPLPLAFNTVVAGDAGSDVRPFGDVQDTMAFVSLNKSAEKSMLLAKSISDTLVFKANLNPKYHQVKQGVFYFECFDTFENSDSITFRIPKADSMLDGQIFTSERDCVSPYWQEATTYCVDSVSGEYVFTLPIADINRRMFVMVELSSAIRLTVDQSNGINHKVYSADSLTLNINATLVNGMEEPLRAYSLKADAEGGEFISPLYFVKGQAKTTLKFPKTWIGNFGDITKIMLRGEDDKVIPYQLNLQNCIYPRSNHSHLDLKLGSALVGNPQRFSRIDNSNTITMATWVRIDSEIMLQGMRPLLLFRGGGKTMGIQLERGELRCHWNEESWSWSTPTGLFVTREMIGEWVHVALAADPTGVTYYLNGKSFRLNKELNPTRVLAGLYIGKNSSTDNQFRGAFDQTSLWSRTLSHEEIIDHMYQAPKPDKDLICYITYNEINSSGMPIDLIEGTPV
ncbi:MAG: LamG-like jellyroll fold domain-containing protein, partial [Bacteroidales bacterium]